MMKLAKITHVTFGYKIFLKSVHSRKVDIILEWTKKERIHFLHTVYSFFCLGRFPLNVYDDLLSSLESYLYVDFLLFGVLV